MRQETKSLSLIILSSLELKIVAVTLSIVGPKALFSVVLISTIEYVYLGILLYKLPLKLSFSVFCLRLIPHIMLLQGKVQSTDVGVSYKKENRQSSKYLSKHGMNSALAPILI